MSIKLTAQEIMRYGAETEREQTLIDFINSDIEDVDGLSEELEAADSRIDDLASFIETTLENFESMDDEDFQEYMKESLTGNPL